MKKAKVIYLNQVASIESGQQMYSNDFYLKHIENLNRILEHYHAVADSKKYKKAL